MLSWYYYNYCNTIIQACIKVYKGLCFFSIVDQKIKHFVMSSYKRNKLWIEHKDSVKKPNIFGHMPTKSVLSLYRYISYKKTPICLLKSDNRPGEGLEVAGKPNLEYRRTHVSVLTQIYWNINPLHELHGCYSRSHDHHFCHVWWCLIHLSDC